MGFYTFVGYKKTINLFSEIYILGLDPYLKWNINDWLKHLAAMTVFLQAIGERNQWAALEFAVFLHTFL